MPDPPTRPDPASERARAGGWFRQHWKEMLAVTVAAVPVLAYFLLHKRSSGSAPATAFLAAPSAGSSGSSSTAAPASAPAAAASQVWNAVVRGIRPGNLGTETTHDLFNAAGEKVAELPFGADIQITGPPQQIRVPWGSSTANVWAYPIIGPGGATVFIQTLDVGQWSTSPISPPVNSNTSAQVFSGI